MNWYLEFKVRHSHVSHGSGAISINPRTKEALYGLSIFERLLKIKTYQNFQAFSFY